MKQVYGRHTSHGRATHLSQSRNERLDSGRKLGLNRHADILLYGSRGGHYCCVDLADVSPYWGSWQDAAFALAIVQRAKREKHTQTCACHSFDHPFGQDALVILNINLHTVAFVSSQS